MKLQAKNNYVVVRIEKKTKSGIVTIKTNQYAEKEEWLKASAIVYSIGPDVKDIKVGDRVIVGPTKSARYDWLTKELEGQDKDEVTYVACKEEDIVAVIN